MKNKILAMAAGIAVMSIGVTTSVYADKVVRTETFMLDKLDRLDLAFNGTDLVGIGNVSTKISLGRYDPILSTAVFVYTGSNWKEKPQLVPATERGIGTIRPWVSMSETKMVTAGANGKDHTYDKINGVWKRTGYAGNIDALKMTVSESVLAGYTLPGRDFNVWIAEQNENEWKVVAEFDGGRGKDLNTADIDSAEGRIAFANSDYPTDGLENAGQVLIFRHMEGQWQQEAAITAPVPVEGAAFGSAIDFNEDGTEILISAPLDGEVPETRGKVYLYRYDDQAKTWDHTATFQVTDRKTLDMPKYATRFGETVALDGDIAVVGNQTDYQSIEQVNIYLREAGEWKLKEVPIKDVSAAGVDAVAVSGDTIAITGYDRTHDNGRIIVMKRVPDDYVDSSSDSTPAPNQPANAAGQDGQRAPQATGSDAGGGAMGIVLAGAGMIVARRRKNTVYS